MIVTIDGPAGAGKSSIARALAERLEFRFLDTGAMYRAVTYAAIRRQHDWSDAAGLAALADSVQIELNESQVTLDGEDVSAEIRTPETTANVHYAANNSQVREHLVLEQRRFAEGLDVVTEGRDQGSVVFPDAECKVFLTATPEERARRRLAELTKAGAQTALEEVLADQELRDERDATRTCGPLVQPEDSVVVVTDGMPEEDIVDLIESMVRGRMTGGRDASWGEEQPERNV